MGFQSLLSRWLVPNRFYGGELPKGKGYSIRAIEFDDQGELWDPRQLEETIAHVQDECRKSQGGSASKEFGRSGEVIVITFTHGWMHNASSEDKNLQVFTDLIRTRANAEAKFAEKNGRLPRPIIGVYLAWRGLLWNIPVVKYFTFWSRKTAALRVGNISCTEVLFRIMRAVKSKNNSSRCIFVGHSFGGLIIESAICKALLGSIFLNDGETTDSPSDLVVLINPACEAGVAKQFIDILKRNKVIAEMGGSPTKDGLPFPILISITSSGDKATKWAFPFGQFFVNLFKSFRKYDNPPACLPSQRRLNFRTAGHITRFHNFRFQPISNREINEDKLEFSFNNGESKYEIVSKENDYNTVPFWLMQAPKEIVPNHSDIFTDGFEKMLSALLHWSITSVEQTKLKCNRADAGTMAKGAGQGLE